jgi:hypothetical protein
MLKNALLRLLPSEFKQRMKQTSLFKAVASIQRLIYQHRIGQIQSKHNKALVKVRGKEKITVAFFIFKESVWKFEELYKLMADDNRFDPIVVICPYTTYGRETMMGNMDRAFQFFKNNGYNVVKTYDGQSRAWLNVKQAVQPDLIFFSAPWYITKSKYLIENYDDVLTCYVPYTFVISHLFQGYFNNNMQNFVWKFFLETQIHQQISKQYARNGGANTAVTGYPGMDRLLRKEYAPVDVWKIKDKKIKRIIWSPHHTIPGQGVTLDYSTFLDYYDFMFDFAKKFENKVQIAFKPHPSLKSKLSLNEFWGKEKTDKYFRQWAELPNGQLNESDYIDLFATSDGMINDSSSFMIEYLYTNKPQLFLLHDENVVDRFNEVGKMALSKHYIGKSESDIESFFENVILPGNDLMKHERAHFFESIIQPPNGLTASENIFNCLKTEFFLND